MTFADVAGADEAKIELQEIIEFLKDPQKFTKLGGRIGLNEYEVSKLCNVLFTREMLAAKGLDPASFILVQKPYMERRTFATFSKVWPDKRIMVTSPRLSLDEYLARYSNESRLPVTAITS